MHINIFGESLYKPTQLTLIALSAPLVMRSGSPWTNDIPEIAVECASRIWPKSFFSSRSHNPICPTGLPAARTGCPSDQKIGGKRKYSFLTVTIGEESKEF